MKYTLKLIFLKCIFEFMINTAPTASNSVYGREKLFWYDKINFSNHVCHCGAVVKEFLARADKPGSTPGNAAFCSFLTFFFPVWSLFFNTIFPFGLFFFILTADPAGHALGSIYILSLRPEFYSLNFIRLLRVVITPSVTSSLRGENDSKQSDEFQARSFILEKGFQKLLICILAKLTTRKIP